MRRTRNGKIVVTLAKYDSLLHIEDELGARARYAARDIFARLGA